MVTKEISSGWSFTQIGGGEGTKDGEWVPVSSFPTTVHVELLKLGRIPDPFVGLHEWDVQWVGESRWAFKTTFEVSESDLSPSYADLVFDGLDTFATVQLNGEKLLETSNQFVVYRSAAKKLLKVGTNELLLEFANAFKKGKEIEKERGKLNLWNGDSSRLYVRKAQYNYGWDWGPILMTVGPWKAIRLHTYDVSVQDVDIRSAVSPELDVNLTVTVNVQSDPSQITNYSLKATLKNPDGTVRLEGANVRFSDSASAQSEFHLSSSESLELWYQSKVYMSKLGLTVTNA